MRNILLIAAATMLMSGAAMAQGFVMAGSPQDPKAAMMATTGKPGAGTLVSTYPGYIWTVGTINPTSSWGPTVTTIATPTNTLPAPPAR
jgi:hypothetical protein